VARPINQILKLTKDYLILITILLYLSACLTPPETKQNHLITINQAKTILKKTKNHRLFEISPSEKYKEGHIKGAFNLWRADYSDTVHENYSGIRATKKQLEQLLSTNAINEETTIFLYDIKGNCNAARFAWQLELWGLNKVHLIDGGKKSWQLEGNPLTKTIPEKPTYQPFKFSKTKEQQSLLATYPEVFAALNDTNTLVIDTRELYEYQGEPFEKDGKTFAYKKGAFTNGAIPTAIHYNWSTAVNLKTDHQLKPIETLQYDLEKAGITPEKNIILYCQSGTRSAHTHFVLRHILNYPNVKNYDGSWIEWSYLNTTQTEEAPIQINK